MTTSTPLRAEQDGLPAEVRAFDTDFIAPDTLADSVEWIVENLGSDQVVELTLAAQGQDLLEVLLHAIGTRALRSWLITDARALPLGIFIAEARRGQSPGIWHVATTEFAPETLKAIHSGLCGAAREAEQVFEALSTQVAA